MTTETDAPKSLSDHEKKRLAWREEEKRVRNAVMKQVVASIVAALGLVVGLAWNSAITATINEFLPATKGGLIAQFGYALVLTLFVGIAAYYITKFLVKDEPPAK